MLGNVLNENITRQKIPQVADKLEQVIESLERIETRLTRFESKLHSLEGVSVEPRKAVSLSGNKPLKLGLPPKPKKTLGSVNLGRIAKLQEIYNKGWWATDIAAIQLEVDTNAVNNIVYEARNTQGWVVDERPINGQRKLFRIFKEKS